MLQWFISYFFNFLNHLSLDKSVLENYHISSSWTLALSSPEFDIFKNMTTDTYKRLRERMIGMVLATDMNSHFSDLAKLKGRLSNSGILEIFSQFLIFF